MKIPNQPRCYELTSTGKNFLTEKNKGNIHKKKWERLKLVH